jgi:hypothetical protein
VDYSRTDMSATLTYTLMRVLIFLAAAVILALFGLRGIPLILIALIISAIISLVFLSKLRDRMSVALSGRLSRFGSKLDAGTKAEDSD